MFTSLGLKDSPIATLDDESLGVRPYAISLSQFIEQCETPLTIAFQGDWGSGKTSLMNIVRLTLKQSKTHKIMPIWINTWQYAQFNHSEFLPVILLNGFIEELGISENDSKDIKDYLFGAVNFGAKKAKKLAEISGNILGSQVGLENIGSDLLSSADSDDLVGSIKKLKNKLQEIVIKKISKNGYSKIVVFIDDLDRLQPKIAVDILETLKLFLDINGCVYVLALDYEVVQRGLEDKFKLSPTDIGGRSFFDKIIQVPFTMPISQYNLDDYLVSMFKKLNISHNEHDIPLIKHLLISSIGLNPRTIKRALNLLTLLKIVNINAKILIDCEDDIYITKVLFGLICLQSAYSHVYQILSKRIQTSTNISEHFNYLSSDNNYTEEDKNFLQSKNFNLEKNSEKIANFLESFKVAILDGSTYFTDNQIQTVISLLSLSNVTSTESSENFLLDGTKVKIANDDISVLSKEYHVHYERYLAF